MQQKVEESGGFLRYFFVVTAIGFKCLRDPKVRGRNYGLFPCFGRSLTVLHTLKAEVVGSAQWMNGVAVHSALH